MALHIRNFYEDRWYVSGFVDTEFEAKFVLEAINGAPSLVHDELSKSAFHAFNMNHSSLPMVEVHTELTISDIMERYITIGMPK
jgi:hypothetical protein